MPRQTKLSLAPDASMSGVELSGFYQTPNHMAMKAIRAKLTSADWCVWSYLQMIDPFGDRFVDIPNHKEIAEIVGLSEKSVKRSVYKLEELGFYDTEVLSMKGKNLAGNAVRAQSGRVTVSVRPTLQEGQKKLDKDVQELTKLSETGQSCPKKDKVVSKRTKLSQNGQSCPKQPLEPAPDKGSTAPHTIQTYSDFKNTLSDSEREEFLKFGEKRAGELKNPPVQLPQKWIEKNWEELSAQWYKSKGQTPLAQTAKWEADPRTHDWLAIIEETANPLEFATDKEKQDFIRWCNETKQFSWLKGES